MYLDTTILQSRTTDTLIEFINDLTNYISPEELPDEYFSKYAEIKRQQRKAKKQEDKEVTI